MNATLIDGKAIAAQMQQEIARSAEQLQKNHGVRPGLAAVLVGEDPASAIYVRNKRRACRRVGMQSVQHHLPAGTSEAELLELIARLNDDASVHGILVQLPLPEQIRADRVQEAVSPTKDVDGLHPENLGRLMQGRARFVPCTPVGVQQMLLRSDVDIEGAHVVVVGRSEIVGKPLVALLMQKQKGANATVTVCHSRTRDLPAITRSGDIVVVAIGRAQFLTADMVRPGAVVIDVGVNRVGDRVVGDVDFESVRKVAARISPVPGGVGPMTITMLLQNTVHAAQQQSGD